MLMESVYIFCNAFKNSFSCFPLLNVGDWRIEKLGTGQKKHKAYYFSIISHLRLKQLVTLLKTEKTNCTLLSL